MREALCITKRRDKLGEHVNRKKRQADERRRRRRKEADATAEAA